MTKDESKLSDQKIRDSCISHLQIAGHQLADNGTSYFPLVLACIACLVSGAFAAPLYAAPITLTFAFVPNVFRDARLWVGLLVGLVGVALGAVMVVVYRASGAWF